MDWKKHFAQAQQNLFPYLRETPLLYEEMLAKKLHKKVFLKAEIFQPTRSFKIRPAYHGLLQGLAIAQKSGVVTTSSGNFAQAVVYAAKQLQVPAQIIMPNDVSAYKLQRVKELGAEVIFSGNTFESRFTKLAALLEKQSPLVLHSFDSWETIAANATIGKELLDKLPHPLTIIVPVSGGGLIAGIASYVKSHCPESEIIGVQPQQGGAVFHSFHTHQIVKTPKVHTIADALVASSPGEKTLPLIEKYVDDLVLVSEEEIQKAMWQLMQQYGVMVEGGGVVAWSALAHGKITPRYKYVVCILSGANVCFSQFVQLYEKFTSASTQ